MKDEGGRLRRLVIAIAVIGGPFLFFKWPVAVFSLAVLNVVACLLLGMQRRWQSAVGALIASALLFAALVFTNWGLSTPQPVVRVAWPWLIAGCIAQAAVAVGWTMPRPSPKGSEP